MNIVPERPLMDAPVYGPTIMNLEVAANDLNRFKKEEDAKEVGNEKRYVRE